MLEFTTLLLESIEQEFQSVKNNGSKFLNKKELLDCRKIDVELLEIQEETASPELSDKMGGKKNYENSCH